MTRTAVRNSSSRGNAASTTSCSTTTDHGCRSISTSARSTHPSASRQSPGSTFHNTHVYALGAQGGGAERAHQPIVDHAAGAVRPEQQPVAAGRRRRLHACGPVPRSTIRVVGDAELHGVAPRVPAQPVAAGHDPPAQLPCPRVVASLRPIAKNVAGTWCAASRSSTASVTPGVGPLSNVSVTSGCRHSGCSTSPPGWRAKRTGSAPCTGPSASHGQPPNPVRW